MKDNKNVLINCLKSFFITMLIMVILLVVLKMAPFGISSFASMDANIQYLDFFGYLSNVLKGQDSISYTFNSTLGNTGVGLFSYYLSSPLNILILLFSKESYLTFFNITLVLKLAICSFTFAYYLQKRFKNEIKNVLVILLSISYALMQYNIAQSSNIMWIDGVYMLPMILLGVYKVINEKKINLLSISVGLSIIFNWYSAGVNCIFSFFWFLIEQLLLRIENGEKLKTNIKNFLKDLLRYVIAMGIGLMISAILFLPSILTLRNGVGSEFDFEVLKNNFNGNIISVIQNYSIGAQSSSSSLAIYCGSLPLIGAISYFINKDEDKNKRILLGLTLFISIMFCYYKPFELIFSLLKHATSYWFRYSYIVIFAFIFIAANYYKDIDKIKDNRKYIVISILFSIILLVLNYLKPITDDKFIYFTGLFMIIISLLIYWMKKHVNRVKVLSIILLIISSIELLYNAKVLENKYILSNGDKYISYVQAQEEQINEIKESDKGIYRISQTQTRNFNDSANSTANYNESLSFDYMSNTGYTSCPDNSTLNFLDKLGYRKEGNRITITNTSLIGLDSLLGVKYISSPYEIKGLERVENIDQANGKYFYSNPYAFSVAFKYIEENNDIEYNKNPFEYQNKIFSKLVGKDVNPYKKLEYKIISKKEQKVIYEITTLNKNYPLYGNLPWKKSSNENINVNNIYNTAYSKWLSPSVFYIPLEEEHNVATIEVTSNSKVSIKEEQFYYLDLEELRDITNQINDKKAEELRLENGGNISCKVSANQGESLLISIPYSNGFNIYRNGEKIDINKFESCLMSIPLVEGENEITIKYSLPGLKIGIVISLLGILLLVFYHIQMNNKNKKDIKGNIIS